MGQINYDKVIENDFELSLYEHLTEKVTEYLKNVGQAGFWDIIRNVGGSERRMLRLLNQMVNTDILVFQGESFKLKSSDNETYYNKTICPKCHGKRVIISQDLTEIESVLKNIWADKPTPTLLFDQRPVTLNTTMNRLSYAMMRGDIKNKDIVFVGDDDLTSIAFGLTGLANRVVVFDIDKRLIDFINEQSNRYDLGIEAVCADVTQGVDEKYYNSFDMFMTDPTPEPIPFTIFMNLGINLLRKDNSSIIYTSIYSSAMSKSIALQEIITSMGLYITDLIPGFTEYQSLRRLFSEEDEKLLKKFDITISKNESICFTETLFRLELTNKTNIKKIDYKNSDLFGKATKRALKDVDKELVNYKSNEQEYIKKVAEMMVQDMDKKSSK